MGTLVNRWLRANKDRVDNLTISKGHFRQIKEVGDNGYSTLTTGGLVKADNPVNWSIMPENFHPEDPKELAGRYLLCVRDNNWSDAKGRPSRGEHILIIKGDLCSVTCNLSAKDMLGRINELAKDRLFGLDPEYKLMAIGFDPNAVLRVRAKEYPVTPDECYHPEKEYPIGCYVTKGNDPLVHRVLGKDKEGVVVSTLGTVGFRITEDHCKHYSIHPSLRGEQAEFLPYSFIKRYTPQWDVSNVTTIVSKPEGCTSLKTIDIPVHSSKWEFPKGCVVDYGDKSYTVIGKSDSFPDRYLLLSKSRGTEGTLIRSDWAEIFHVDMIYVGKYGIWAYKQKMSFNKDSPQNKHELAKLFGSCTNFQATSSNLSPQENTSLENDPVTRKVKLPKFQHKRTAY